jgi:hypothetical protein
MSKERHTTDGEPPDPDHWDGPAPKPVDPKSGQHGAYWVLSPEERAKGFTRPVRRSYKHVGPPAAQHEMRDLTLDESVRYAEMNYVKFETYPDSESCVTGRFWTQAQLDSVGGGCGAVTTMGVALAESYAAQPDYYGATFCCACRDHLPVGAQGEFVWEGTDQRVGT